MLERLSFVQRFAAVSLALTFLIGLALAELVSSMNAHRGLESATDAAILTTRLAVQPLLTADDLADGLSPEKVAALDRALASDIGTADGRAEIARIKIWNARQRVVYVADPHTPMPDAARGGHPSHELAEALAGTVEAELVGESIEADNASLLRRYGRLLEVYVPITYPGSDAPAGVFELYLPYEPVRAAVREDTARAIGLLAAGLAVLWVGLFRLVTAASRRLREEAARHDYQAHHDALTGLPNRVRLAQRLDEAVRREQRDAGGVGLALLDLDRFREINDSLGHATGDDVVNEVGRRLQAALTGDELLARIGGDEFAVLLPAVADVDAARRRVEELLEVLSRPVSVAGLDVAVGASAGLALAPLHADDAGALLQRADVALYAAKNAHQQVAVYDPAVDDHGTDRLQLLAELRHGITAGQLVLHYQPKCDLGGRLHGVEALVRWAHPRRGLLAPHEFVPLAESTGLIHPLTDEVLDRAVGQARRWLDAGIPTAVAVNVSTRSLLDNGFADRVLGVLRGWRVPAHLLGLEITETTIMADPERALTVLRRLSDAGVRLAIDDFGTGYSSLAYLKRLPVHELKIDRSFVAGMVSSERDRVIVDSTVALGHRLGLEVVAEGVEDPATLSALAELGCELAQGFLFSRPVPAGKLPDLRRPVPTA